MGFSSEWGIGIDPVLIAHVTSAWVFEEGKGMEKMKKQDRVHDGSGMFAGGCVLGYPYLGIKQRAGSTNRQSWNTKTSNTCSKNEMDSACGPGDMATSGSFSITSTLVPNQTIASELLGTFSAIYIPAISSKGFYL